MSEPTAPLEAPPSTEPSALADLRHDMRTPVGHVLGYGEMVIDELQERGLHDLIPDVERMRTAGCRLLALINERLNMAALGLLTSSSPQPAPALAQTSITRQADSERTPTAPALPSEETGRLLVVDDNQENRDVLTRRLERQGHTLRAASSGAEALAELAQEPFDLVFLDIMMPEMDGYEVLARIKADPSTHSIPVIMISALDELDSVVRCIEMGAADYLPKPFNPILLRARTVACLREKRARDREQRFTEELQESYRRLQELERLRDDLVNMIVHDLRTPLTSLLTGLQTVPLVGDLNETQQEMVTIATEGGQSLLRMINDLLDVEKMEAGSLALDLTNLSAADLIGRAVSQVAFLAQSSSLTLLQEISDGLPEFAGDEDKLCRTLVNLLGNAIKFTPEGGSVTVAARLDDDQQSLLFYVHDTGEGIPSEAFARIFEKFGQVESRSRGRKMSTGLGLTFCKLTVEAHNGRIAVQSAPGEGSTFFFSIPQLQV